MSESLDPRDSRDTSAAGDPGCCASNLRLLHWRLLLAAALTLITILLALVGSDQISRPGVIGSLGLLYTSLAVSWAAAMARAPLRPLLGFQFSSDLLCIGLLVHFSGGPFSALPLVFLVPVLLTASYLDARWSIAAAGAAAILTGGGHFGLALGWLLTGKDVQLDYLSGWPVLVTALHMSVFVVAGMIGGDMARKLAARRDEQRQTQLQVEKASCEVRNIMDNIKSGLLTVDQSGVITRANPSCCGILKLPSTDLVGRDARLVMADGMEEFADILLPVARGGDPINRGEIEVRRSRRVMPLGLNVSQLIGPQGRVAGAIAIFTDLTQEKELTARMREADRLAAIGELAASIAHEIRNPLASIRGSVEILAGELDLVGYQRQLLDLVLKESGRVNTIIDDFLGYSRMRPARQQRFSSCEFRDEITLLIRQHIAAKDGRVRVICDICPEKMEIVADPSQLTQMALNLAINACEAMNYNGILRLAVNQLGAAESCELVVTDNGPGIEPEIREKLFAPFKTTKEGGTGLGLSVVARIANAHGGTVRVEDAPGGGAIFRVRWPLDHSRPQLSVALSAPEPVEIEDERTTLHLPQPVA